MATIRGDVQQCMRVPHAGHLLHSQLLASLVRAVAGLHGKGSVLCTVVHVSVACGTLDLSCPFNVILTLIPDVFFLHHRHQAELQYCMIEEYGFQCS